MAAPMILFDRSLVGLGGIHVHPEEEAATAAVEKEQPAAAKEVGLFLRWKRRRLATAPLC